VDVLLSDWGPPVVDAEFLAHAPRLKAIFYGAGSICGIVTEAVWDRGIIVSSAYGANAVPVAEYTLASILFSLKHAWRLAHQMRQQKRLVDREAAPGGYGSRVGLISLGAIGRRVLELLAPFHCDIYAYDPHVPRLLADIYDITLTSLEQVMGCDVVISLVPLTPETQRVVTAKELDLLRPGAVFVNVSRGAVVDQDALIKRLQRNDIVASLDVFDPEPLEPDSPLRQMGNVFLTPHIAGVTAPCGPRFLTLAADEIERKFAGHRTRHDLVPRAAVKK
jgi:phosphoglycerate dehydrogenase-like enzyme